MPVQNEDIPQTIGKYKIQGLIAKGGMGAVYKAIHPSLKRTVILKKLTIRNNSTIRERFKREAQILLDMQCPQIVHLFDYFVEGSSHYIVEECVEGLSLAQVLEKQRSLDTQISLVIFLEALKALKFAHKKGIVHRDIKPGNILISKGASIKLADFGIASSESGDDIKDSAKSKTPVKNQPAQEGLTQVGTALGTPAYMSPEQITDSRSVDKRADIYSMGVMLYEMLTGVKPFPSTLSQEMLDKINKGKYIKPRELDKSIPVEIDFMIRKMLRANPAKRYQSVDPIIKIVTKYLSHFDSYEIRVALAKIVSSKKPYEVPKFERKKSVSKIAVLSVAAVLVAVFGIRALWNAGAFHYTILRPWYTPVTLEMNLPTTGSNVSDLPVQSFCFVDDNDKIPEVKGSSRIFVKVKNQDAGAKKTLYRTKTFFVRSGRPESIQTIKDPNTGKKSKVVVPAYPAKYRIKIAVGPYILWRSLPVEKTAVNLRIESLANEKRFLQIQTYSFDLKTEKNLTSKTNFYVLVGNKWLPADRIPRDRITTGGVVHVKAVSPGYKEAVFGLLLDWYQDTLIVNAGLEKE